MPVYAPKRLVLKITTVRGLQLPSNPIPSNYYLIHSKNLLEKQFPFCFFALNCKSEGWKRSRHPRNCTKYFKYTVKFYWLSSGARISFILSFKPLPINLLVCNMLHCYTSTQIRFLIGGERVTCHWSKLHDALGRTKLHDALGQQQL